MQHYLSYLLGELEDMNLPLVLIFGLGVKEITHIPYFRLPMKNIFHISHTLSTLIRAQHPDVRQSIGFGSGVIELLLNCQ
ncbi:hypothetical protein ACJX0J_022203, partial [Zea mays]